MTDEEKTEEYLRCKWECGSYDRNNKRCLYKNKCIKYQIYLDGLAEGKKELEEENARLSKMLEMAIDFIEQEDMQCKLCSFYFSCRDETCPYKEETPISDIIWTELEKRVKGGKK